MGDGLAVGLQCNHLPLGAFRGAHGRLYVPGTGYLIFGGLRTAHTGELGRSIANGARRFKT